MNLVLVAIGFGLGQASGQGGLMIAWECHVGGFIAGLLLVDVFSGPILVAPSARLNQGGPPWKRLAPAP